MTQSSPLKKYKAILFDFDGVLGKTMEDNHKVEIQPSQIDIGKEINKIGTYEAKINLHAEIQAKIHIEVVKKEEKN